MKSEIIVSLITFLGSAMGTLSGIMINTKLTNYRLEMLEKKVDKHNQVIDRVYKLEEFKNIEAEKIKVINHRIDDLEEFCK